MRPRWVLVAALLTCGFAPAPFPKPEKKPAPVDIQALQGTWSIEVRHRVLPDGKLGHYGTSAVKKVRIEGERWSYVAVEATGERVTVAYKLSVENTKLPHWFDAVQEKRPTAAMRGVFILEGDTLKMVYRFASTGNVERPTSLTTPPPGASVMVMKRIKS